MSSKSEFSVAVVGATGLVGETMINILEERQFPVAELSPLASNRSLGKSVSFNGRTIPVQELEGFDFSKVDIGLFSPGAEVSRVYAPKAAAAGCVVIDNEATPKRTIRRLLAPAATTSGLGPSNLAEDRAGATRSG